MAFTRHARRRSTATPAPKGAAAGGLIGRPAACHARLQRCRPCPDGRRDTLCGRPSAVLRRQNLSSRPHTSTCRPEAAARATSTETSARFALCSWLIARPLCHDRGCRAYAKLPVALAAVRGKGCCMNSCSSPRQKFRHARVHLISIFWRREISRAEGPF